MFKIIILLILPIYLNKSIYTFGDVSRSARRYRQSDQITNKQFLASGDHDQPSILDILLHRLKKPRSFDCDQPLDEIAIIEGDTNDITTIIKSEPKDGDLHSLKFHIFANAVQNQFYLNRIPIIGDGNCGFRSILVAAGKCLQGHYPAGETNHIQLRHDTVEYVKNRMKHYETLFSTNDIFLKWIKEMQKNGEWLDEIGLRAVAELHQLQIVVFRPFEILRIFEPCNYQPISETIYILHNGKNHYEALSY